MKLIPIVLVLTCLSFSGLSQKIVPSDQLNRKGNFFIYWGYNWEAYTDSDIKFKGNDYNFFLSNVRARDRQTAFSFSTYLNPTKFTIPQYNFRIGYFLMNNFNISVGLEHMKYKVIINQVVPITGEIHNSQTIYDGYYVGNDIALKPGFLLFEHTDGLNYLNIELKRFDKLFSWKKMTFNLTEGIGFGAIITKTNATLLNNERYDDFHLSGYGVNPVIGINLSIGKVFYIQSDLKGGFIHLPDIRTTNSVSDKASQHFFFTQVNILFGANIRF